MAHRACYYTGERMVLADTLRRSEGKFEGVERGVKGDLTALLLRPPGEGEAPPLD